jgi:T5SS/PEP-CTERM-associated repeat protein
MLALGAAHAETGVTNIVDGVTNNAAGPYYVGNTGSFNGLIVTNAGQLVVTGNGMIGNATGSSNNSALVTGSSSVWSNSSLMIVGFSGLGNQLTIQNGGLVNNTTAYLGYNASSSNNTVTVTGGNSLWKNSNEFHLGENGAGNQLIITNGGVVAVATTAYVGYSVGAKNNSALVTGTGSVWTNSGLFIMGLNSPGNSLNIANSGAVFAANATVGLNASSTDNQLALAGGNLTVAGALDVRRGTLTFNGGGLDVGTLLATNNPAYPGNSFFNFNYGTLTTRAGSQILTPIAGGDFFIGQTAGQTATWNILGGTNSITPVSGYSANTILGGNDASASVLATGVGTVWSNRGDLIVGYATGASNNHLSISAGAQVVNANGYLGFDAGPHDNSVLVTGSNTLWRNNGILGLSGSASQMAISDGGQVVNADGTVAGGFAVTVTGSGSVWTNTGFLHLVGSGNSLTITNSGAVYDTSARIGSGSTASNTTVLVTGGGALWNNSGDLTIGYGNGASRNQFTVTNGGAAVSLNGWVGYGNGASNNTVTVTGSSSVWSNSGTLFVGYGTNANNNQLTIGNGGQVQNTKGDIGYDGGNNSVAVTGATSRWNMSDILVVGDHTAGNQLTITGGAQVTNTAGYIGYAATASSNAVTVSGNGSVWNSGTNLTVGFSGNGNQLMIADGAQALSDIGYVGYNSGADNNAILATGSGSTWTNTGSIRVGYMGGNDNSLIVSNGATVSAGGALILTSGDRNVFMVVGIGSVLTVGGNVLANSGYAQNTVTDGAKLYAASGYVQSDYGKLLITGSGSVWSNTGTFYFGNNGDYNELTIANGGAVYNTTGHIGRSTGGGNSMLVTGNGSVWNNSGDLNIGSGWSNTLTIANNGAVLVGGTATIGYEYNNPGQAITLDGGSLAVTNASATGTLNVRKGTLILNSGTITADSFIATNGANSVLAIELDGVGLDPVLTVNGTAQLGGTLNVTNQAGFTPALSNTYTILAAASVTGQFVATNLSTLGGGMRWSVLYSTTSVVAQAVLQEVPSVTTVPVSNVTYTTAQCGGNVTVQGISPVTARGVCWNNTGSPTTADSHTTDGSGTGSFASQLAGLMSGQTYYVRAYASNSDGTAYGEERTFATPMIPPGNALAFDGADDYVSISDANSLDMTSNYTLECWFKADSFGGLRGLISKYQTSDANGYLLRLTGIELEFDGLTTSGLGLQAGQWYHAAAVSSNGTRTLYVNGIVRTISGAGYTVLANSDPLRLASDFGGRYFAGQLDEVRVWNIARTPADILDAMHKQLTGNESGLAAYHQFNQAAGALSDVTPNNNNGTLVNGPVWINSTIPCANVIASRANLRGVWLAQTNSLVSGRFSVTNAVASSTNCVVFGHDNAADAWQTADVPAGVNNRLTRLWRAEVSGSATGNIKLDTTGLSSLGDGSLLRLLVDADGSFSNATALTGIYSAPYFTVSGQAIANGNYYTLGNNIPQFTDSGSTIPAATSAWHGAVWGDYNNDGYLDFVLNGLLYRNNGNNTFTDMSASAGLTLITNGTGAAAWGDFDGDGYLDLALSGNTGSGYITKIYRNNGNGTFTDINAGLPGLYYSSVAWGDYDNDGRPDLLLAGAGSGGNITRIYRNNGDNTFSDSGISLPGITQGDAAWGDYNNDGRLDVVVHGNTVSSGKITWIYRNNGDNTFTDISAGLTGDSWGSVAWMDYNNDGKLDLLISGTSGSTNNLLYRNNGGGSFTEMAGTSLGMSQRSSAAWGDFNNDGTPDILISGSPSRSYFYRNNGNDTFTDIVAGLPNALWGGVAMADYDNDGRLDFLFSGGTAILYHNASGVSSNSAPTAPGNLQATRTGNTTFTFTWNAATDSETPADGLSYNLRIGTASGKDDVMPSNSDSNGYRRVAALGNVQMNRTWELTLAPGTTYHWSVQAIDSGLKGGTWGTEQTIVIPNLPVVTTADITTMTTTSAQSGGDITAAGDSAVTVRGVCWNSTGTPTLSDTCTTNGSGIGSYTSSLTGLTVGQSYYVRAYATSASGTGYGSQKAFVLSDSSTSLTPPGNALVFIGASNQYVQISHSVELGFTANYTLELWLKADAVTGIQTLVSKGGTGWSLGLNNSEVVFDGLTTSGLGLTTGAWYHVAAVNSNGTRYLYVNGVATTLSGTATTVQYGIDAVTIGSGSGYFSGRLDDLRIWNVARSEQEVRENMHLVPGGAKPGLIAYYDFDETSDTALYDRSQSAILHNGTLTNMVGTEWNRSTIPAGSGSANSQTEVETDTITFSGTDLLAYFTTAGTASLTTTRITADLPTRGSWWTVSAAAASAPPLPSR